MPPRPLPPFDADASLVQRWLRTVAWTVVGVALLALGFFFALIALAVVSVLIAVIALRWWWITRSLRRAASSADTVVEGEYRVVERAPGEDDAGQKRD